MRARMGRVCYCYWGLFGIVFFLLAVWVALGGKQTAQTPAKPKDRPSQKVSQERLSKGCCSYWSVNKYFCSFPTKSKTAFCLAHRADRTPEEEKLFKGIVLYMLGCQEKAEEVFGAIRRRMNAGKETALFERIVTCVKNRKKGNGKHPPVNFEGFHFPKYLVNFNYTGNRISDADADETRWTSFRKVTFEGRVDFTNATFPGDADFWWATFKGDAVFNGVRIGRHALFKGAKTNATGTSTMYFHDAIIKGRADFENAKLYGGISFKNAVIKELNFNAARLFGRVVLSGVEFGGEPNCGAAQLPMSLNLDGVRVPDGMGESLFRFGKQVYRNMGRYQEAGEWHYRQRSHALTARKRALRKDRGWLTAFVKTLPEEIFIKGVFGYGERPWRVLSSALLVILAWALSYWLAQRRYKGRNDAFCTCVYFSVLAFTTVGFGSLRPKEGRLVRCLIALQATSGALLMALFLVTLTRRYAVG